MNHHQRYLKNYQKELRIRQQKHAQFANLLHLAQKELNKEKNPAKSMQIENRIRFLTRKCNHTQ